jgi:hypothetical protein
MSRRITTGANWVVGFVIGYFVASRSLDRQGAMKAGLVSAFITAGIAWVSYDKRD